MTTWPRGLIAAACVALLAVATFCTTLVRAALPARFVASAEAGPSAPEGATQRRAGLSEEALQLAAERDPFAPERGAAPDTVPTVVDEPAPQVSRVEVLGTVVLAEDRGVAMLREEGAAARLVRVGQALGTWTLKRVEPGRAHLQSADGETLVIPVSRKH
jgi:hypothetical protein